MPDRIPTIIAGMEDLANEIRAMRTTALHQKVITALLATVVALMLIAGAGFGYLLYWPSTPLVFRSLTVKSGQHVKGPLVYNASYCRYNPGTATVARNLIGVGNTHFNYVFAPVASIARQGCGDANIDLDLPAGVHPGTYVMSEQAAFTVHTSPLRIVSVPAASDRFTLVP